VLTDENGDRQDDYFAFQGTSMASPHVAAAAALVMSRGVKDPAEVRQILEKSATSKRPQKKYGAGLLNAAKAVDATETSRRDSLARMIFAVVAGCLGMGISLARGGARGLTSFPWMPLGFVAGVLGPDLVFGWLGFGSAFNVVLHSALVPLFLLSEAESRTVNRFVAMLSLGVAIHLGWDAYHGHVPFGGVLPGHALPWLWTNTVVAAGAALVAWVRAYTRP
jgi:serine protease